MQGLRSPQRPHSSTMEMGKSHSTWTGLHKVWVPPPSSPSREAREGLCHVDETTQGLCFSTTISNPSHENREGPGQVDGSTQGLGSTTIISKP